MDGDAVKVVHPPGTHKARRVGGPTRVWPGGSWVEHCVIDRQLATSCEHIEERHLTVLALEGVLLFHQFPRKIAALAAQLVAKARELLFFRQVLLASLRP